MLKNKLTAAAAAMCILLCGCSNNKDIDSQTTSITDISITAQQVFDAVKDKDYAADMNATAVFGDDVFTANCEKLYGEPAENFTDGGIMYVSSGASADKISVLAGDSDCEKLLKDRVDRRVSDFEGYKPDELDKIRSAEVFEYGGLWIMIVSDKSDNIRSDIQAIS